jgi:ubiquinone/menaquinone biosynthesis C-methylase UbiE
MTTTTINKPEITIEATPPQAIVMQMVMGAWVSQTISAVTRLNVPDALKRRSPQSALELTQESGIKADPEFLQRALRACASVGIFTEDADGKFGATALSDVLTLDSAVSVKKITEIFGGSWWQVWGGLYDALQTGQSQAKSQLGMEYWDYCKANPQEMEDFGEAMKSNSLNSLQGVIEHCDFSDVSQIADIGGGFGHLAIELAKKHQHLTGIVLDMPELIPVAQKHMDTQDLDLISRIKFLGGDMFEAVPPAQVYIMKHIIHDWDDEHCLKLLKNCYASMEGKGRIICVDSVLPPMGNTDSAPAKLLDLDMMVFIPGKERTEKQWRNLYHDAGFEIASITPIHDNFGTSIIEGVKI